MLFLDFDGVMNTPDWCRAKGAGLPAGQRMTEFAPAAIRELNRILRACDVAIVVSSSWRLEANLDLLKILEANGVDDCRRRYLGATPDLSRRDGCLWTGATRGQEIMAWLKANPQSGKVAILDDDASAGISGACHFQTDLKRGLTGEIADAVIGYFSRP